jgi:hypothetical protein
VSHIFSPFRIQLLPSLDSTARALAFIASEADDASDSEYELIHSPEANFGRYLRFCASVPKYTIGNVPMPVWPMNETAKLPSRADFSETRHPETLSRPRPPYSSGISTPRRPSSPAFRSKSRVAGTGA